MFNPDESSPFDKELPVFTNETALTPVILSTMSLAQFEAMDPTLRAWFDMQVDRVLSEIGKSGLDAASVYVPNLGKSGWPNYMGDKDSMILPVEWKATGIPFKILEGMALTEYFDAALSNSASLREAVFHSMLQIQESQRKKNVVTRAFLEVFVLVSGKLMDMQPVSDPK
ncbi:hypothetical protein Peetri_00097 [Pseudomonas phage vB_PpuM-Peetri]